MRNSRRSGWFTGPFLVLVGAELRAHQPTPTPPPPHGIHRSTGAYTRKAPGDHKVDLIHDFDEIGSTDSFDVRTIPTSGANDPGSNTRIHARQSRFNLDVSGPTDRKSTRLNSSH